MAFVCASNIFTFCNLFNTIIFVRFVSGTLIHFKRDSFPADMSYVYTYGRKITTV